MSSDAASQRADALSAEAAQCAANKEPVKAAQLAREAISLDSDNEKARQILQSLQKEDAASQLPELCAAFIHRGQNSEGEKALQYLKQHPRLTESEGKKCAEILLGHREHSKQHIDELTGAVITSSLWARHVLIERLHEQPTDTFRLLWDRGDKSMQALAATVVDRTIWKTVKDQEKSIRDTFQLALSYLLAPGQDHAERAMSVVARLLATESKSLMALFDADTFEIIVPFLDIRLPASIRSQATLAMIKLLEMTKEAGKEHLGQFITYHVTRGHNEDLIVAFSAATAAFPVVPESAAALFLTEGFLPSLIPHLDQNSQSPESRKSHKLEHVALELFSAACIDKACREAVSKFAGSWLQEVAETSLDPECAGLAALVLAKLSQIKSEKAPQQDVSQLSTILANMTINAENDAQRQNSIEGLAYASLDANVKESIASNDTLLQRIVNVLKSKDSSNSAIFGCLTVLANLTAYKPSQSEEQRKMSQLKAYANSSKPLQDNPLEDDAHVTARCRKMLDAGVVPPLLDRTKGASAATLTAIVQIVQSLSKEQKHRGTMAQQGVVKFLLLSIVRLDDMAKDKSVPVTAIRRTASHSLARILISANPNHVFSGALPAVSALRPLVDLLGEDAEAEQRDLLPTFESLLALTNLASMDDDNIRDSIIRVAWQQIEDLLLSSNALVQRASVELICNLMASPVGVAKFADGSKQASHRMQILLALADAVDLATRRAAGGALAALTEWDAAVKAVLDKERGAKIVLTMCQDESDEVKHRGVVCLLNIISAPDGVGKNGLDRVKAANGAEILKASLQQTKNPQVMQIGIEALKKIVETQ